MLSDVQAFFDKIEEARKAYTDAQSALDAARVDGWEALKTSTDPFVAFLAERVPVRYRDHAESVLRILPATADQVRAWARENGIDTAAVEELLQAAQAVSVFPSAPGAPENRVRAESEREALRSWARVLGGSAVTPGVLSELMAHVDRISDAENQAPAHNPA